MAANPVIESSATARAITEGIAASIRIAEAALARVRIEGNEGQAERWRGYLDVLVGADVALGAQPAYVIVDRCARYAHSHECALRLSRPCVWRQLMERTGRQEAIRQLWRLCS